MDGLYLSLVSIIYSLAVAVLPLNEFLSILLWAVKFTGCLYLLWFFMKKWSNQSDAIGYSESFNYGFIVCLLSSVICACFGYARVEWIFPDYTEESINLVKEVMMEKGTLTSSAEEMMDSISSNFGRITMFVTLVYYTIFGAIAAAITANFTKKTNPFGDTENE